MLVAIGVVSSCMNDRDLYSGKATEVVFLFENETGHLIQLENIRGSDQADWYVDNLQIGPFSRDSVCRNYEKHSLIVLYPPLLYTMSIDGVSKEIDANAESYNLSDGLESLSNYEKIEQNSKRRSKAIYKYVFTESKLQEYGIL